jgi:hypothetical protein
VDELKIWEIFVESKERSEHILSFNGLNNIPLNYDILLTNESKVYNLREGSEIRFFPNRDLTKFKIILGMKDIIKEQIEANIPKDYFLGNNYPNPFNPTSTIPIEIPKESEIELSVYDLLGKKLSTLYEGSIKPGRYYFTFEGKGIPSGIYVYRLVVSGSNPLSTEKINIMKKMLLLK